MMTRNKNNTSTNLQKENLEEEDNIKNKDEEIKKREISYCVFLIFLI